MSPLGLGWNLSLPKHHCWDSGSRGIVLKVNRETQTGAEPGEREGMSAKLRGSPRLTLKVTAGEKGILVCLRTECSRLRPAGVCTQPLPPSSTPASCSKALTGKTEVIMRWFFCLGREAINTCCEAFYVLGGAMMSPQWSPHDNHIRKVSLIPLLLKYRKNLRLRRVENLSTG